MNKVACTLSPMTCSKNWALLLVGPGHQGGVVVFCFPVRLGAKNWRFRTGPFKGVQRITSFLAPNPNLPPFLFQKNTSLQKSSKEEDSRSNKAEMQGRQKAAVWQSGTLRANSNKTTISQMCLGGGSRVGGQRSSKHLNSFLSDNNVGNLCEENSLLVGNSFLGTSLETGTLSSHVGFSQGLFTSFSAFPKGLFVQNIVKY